jgi:ribosome maturation factor RimP
MPRSRPKPSNVNRHTVICHLSTPPSPVIDCCTVNCQPSYRHRPRPNLKFGHTILICYLCIGKREQKGAEAFPSFFNMAQDTQIQVVQALVEGLLDGDTFLVEVRVKHTNNFKVFLDADSGLSIDKCIKINRALYKLMEEKALYPNGDFSLEVSSPGIGEPLKLLRQYHKNIGRQVEVQLNDGTQKEGKLVAVTETAIGLEQTEGKGKKAVTATTEWPLEAIKHTKVLISF